MKKGRKVPNTALIVASGLLLAGLPAQAFDPPEGLLAHIAARATENAKARDNYTYRQSVTVQEFDHRDMVDGQYHEVVDVTFSPSGSRYEQVVSPPKSTLAQIKLTPQDFADIRNIQPFLLTSDTVWLYRGTYKGEETMDGFPCYVEYVEPKQILSGQRFFQGLLWVRKSDYSVVRSEGQAVPQIDTLKQQNLFPHFTTIYKDIDGKWMFPVRTYADDTLFFRNWPQRIRIVIDYGNYKRFGAESTLTYGGESAPPPAQNPQQPATVPPPAASPPH
jgi:hypothetical protein